MSIYGAISKSANHPERLSTAQVRRTHLAVRFALPILSSAVSRSAGLSIRSLIGLNFLAFSFYFTRCCPCSIVIEGVLSVVLRAFHGCEQDREQRKNIF